MSETISILNEIEEKNGISFLNYFAKKFLAKKDNSDKESITKELKKAQEELESALSGYDFADSPELVDYHTYNIKAAQTRYEYLLKKAKEKGL